MGTKPRTKQEHLADKIRDIRLALGLSQAEMWKHLGVEDLIASKQIPTYELGKREPPLRILLQYARAANVSTDILIDDNLNLPAKLPAKPKHSHR
jgi:transcriptional regulator with XRE-family HTH domain